MPQFNLEEYDLVEDRIRAFYADHPDGRIVSYEVTDEADRAKGYFVVRAQIYEDHEDQHMNCPKATGLAFEIEGTAGANKTAALENAETSAIGRALANANYASKKRPSRTEMEKAARGPQPRSAAKPVPDGFLVKIDASVSVEELTAHWEAALAGGFSEDVKELFTKRKVALANE
jgi:hypothetical protein